jgi:hypothetical protein
MGTPSPFKWRHFEGDMMLLSVRWYLRYTLSYRDVEELMRERRLAVDHTTIFRWLQRYAPELEQRCRPCLKATSDSYCVDETYIKVKSRGSPQHSRPSRAMKPYTGFAKVSSREWLKGMSSSRTKSSTSCSGWSHNERSPCLCSCCHQFLHHYPPNSSL